MQVEIRAAVDQFRRGDTETAFFELIEMTDDVCPRSSTSFAVNRSPMSGLF
jgi:hypothetical protein